MNLQVKLTTKDFFRFYIYHMYSGYVWIVNLVVGICAVIFGAVRWTGFVWYEKYLLSLCVFVFIFWQPISCWAKAYGQAHKEVHKSAVEYIITDDFITTAQGERRQQESWKNVRRAVKAASLYMLYIKDNTAFLIPTDAVGDKRDVFESYVKRHVAMDRRKGF